MVSIVPTELNGVIVAAGSVAIRTSVRHEMYCYVSRKQAAEHLIADFLHVCMSTKKVHLPVFIQIVDGLDLHFQG